MLEKNVSTNTDNGKGLEQLLEQLDAMRDALDAIEDKVDPAPRPYPDTFDQGKIYLVPLLKQAKAVSDAADAFYVAVKEFENGIYSKGENLADAAKCNKNSWRLVGKNLAGMWASQLAQLKANISNITRFPDYLTLLVALASDCDLEAMQAAIGEVQDCGN